MDKEQQLAFISEHKENLFEYLNSDGWEHKEFFKNVIEIVFQDRTFDSDDYDGYQIVFKFKDDSEENLYMIEGSYSSYSGTDMDNEIIPCKSQERTIIEYVRLP
jgi:hypothetical protein